MDKKRILIVEDEAITAMDIKNSLQGMGYIISGIADYGEEAIDFADTLKPDLILMDVMLKGDMDGTEAARQITQKHHIPIIFLTAYNDIETFSRAKEAVPYGYLTKPFASIDLRIVVELALFKHQIETEAEAETTRLKNEFLSKMSHELRTPLTCIIGFTKILNSEHVNLTIQKQKEFFGSILSNSCQLLKLVENVLNLTELESGAMKFFLKPVNLNHLIGEVINTVGQEVSEKSLTLDVNIDPTVSKITIDSEKLKEVIYNYVSNAIKFTPIGGRIEIRIFPEDAKFLRIEVKDNGVGISEEKIKKLFLPFPQVDLDPISRGAGLGLAATRRIVEAQGGKVGVSSTFGKGSTFFLLLPRKPILRG